MSSYSRSFSKAGCVAATSLGIVTATALAQPPAGRPVPLPAAIAPAPGDWPAYNRTLQGDRYSPLGEINRANVTRLKQVCAYELPEVTSLQTGPLVVGGVMYFTTDTISYAIDAATCAEKWKVVRHSDTPSPLGVNRGFVFMDGRLFRGTSDAKVLAMDANDGRVIWEHEIDAKGPGVTIPMAPIAASGMVFVGNAGGDMVGVTGHVYALDARDGRMVWRFDVVPDSGPTTATWPNAPRVPLSGGAFWTSFTYDPDRNVLYVPAGNPAPDFDLEERAGDNLYTNSVIALDATTGMMLGFNQLVKRDVHDWDVDSPPTLVRTNGGRLLVLSANKDGLLSVLDRGSIRPLGELPVGGALGLKIPLLYQVATTTRLNADVPLSKDTTVRFCPGILGGSEWNGAAFDAASNTAFVGAVDWCSKAQLAPDSARMPPAGEQWLGVANPNDMFDPPENAKGWLTAFNVEDGSERWKFAAPKPVLAAVTPTAGGIVFSADLGGQLRAFDMANGKVLWEVDTGQSTGGGIVTYQAGGRQLVGVASGMKSPVWPGGAEQSRMLVFGLR